jgi:hypothetical protein
MTATGPSNQGSDTDYLKLRHIAMERGLGGLSNNTKWRELIERIYTMDWCGPHYRYKCIDSEQINANNGDWHALPQPFMSIEWLDVSYVEEVHNGRLLARTLVDHSNEIEAILQAIGLDYRKGEGCIRIFGYAPRCEAGMKGF